MGLTNLVFPVPSLDYYLMNTRTQVWSLSAQDQGWNLQLEIELF